MVSDTPIIDFMQAHCKLSIIILAACVAVSLCLITRLWVMGRRVRALRTITKVLGGSAPAPYAIVITTRLNDPMEEISSGRRLSTIHLLAASLEDAIKMRRALVKEIEVMQRGIEHRQGNRRGYLKSAVRS